MSTNSYFQTGRSIGSTSEQSLLENLIIESIKIYGMDCYYLPRTSVNPDNILNEDPLNIFSKYAILEMYLLNINGFSGDGDFLSRFGLEIRDSATFMVAKKRWNDFRDSLLYLESDPTYISSPYLDPNGGLQLADRPSEGDVIYFPLTKAFFNIKHVESKNPFFQLGRLYTFNLDVELLKFSNERFNTGVSEIDDIVSDKSTDITNFGLILEGGGRLLLNQESDSALILNSFEQDDIDPFAANDDFMDSNSILDFSNDNPFGEPIH
jgi:hypothetical protein